MKRIFYFLLSLTLVVIAGCKKDLPPISDSLTGTWELKIDVDGMTGQPTYHKSGNDTLAKFTENTYAFYHGKNLFKSGNYIIKKDTLHITNEIKYRIIYDNDNTWGEFIDIKNNQLTFTLDAYDAGSTVYQRVK